jgi:hypothetical protein
MQELRQAREQYIATAQRQIGGYDGAISEIERLLAGLDQPRAVEEDGENDAG